MQRCGLLSDFPGIVQTDWVAYRNECSSVFEGTAYSILDSLLNNGKYDVFESSFSYLLSCLRNEL